MDLANTAVVSKDGQESGSALHALTLTLLHVRRKLPCDDNIAPHEMFSTLCNSGYVDKRPFGDWGSNAGDEGPDQSHQICRITRFDD